MPAGGGAVAARREAEARGEHTLQVEAVRLVGGVLGRGRRLHHHRGVAQALQPPQEGAAQRGALVDVAAWQVACLGAGVGVELGVGLGLGSGRGRGLGRGRVPRKKRRVVREASPSAAWGSLAATSQSGRETT